MQVSVNITMFGREYAAVLALATAKEAKSEPEPEYVELHSQTERVSVGFSPNIEEEEYDDE